MTSGLDRTIGRTMMRAGIAVVVAVTLSSCGSRSEGEAAAGAGVAQLERDRLNTESLMEGTYEQIIGTAEQRNLVGRLIFVRFQGAIADCMATAGYYYEAPPYFDTYPGWTRMGVPSDALALQPIDSSTAPGGLFDAGLTTRAAAAELVAMDARLNPGYAAQEGAAARSRYVDTIGKCEPDPATYENLRSHHPDADLYHEFRDLLMSVDENDLVRTHLRGYGQCMGAAGYEAETPDDASALADAAFESFMVAAEADRSSTSWLAAEKVARSLASADRACREAAHSAALDVVGPELTRFVAEHSDALAKAAAHWASLAAEAEVAQLRIPELVGEFGRPYLPADLAAAAES